MYIVAQAMACAALVVQVILADGMVSCSDMVSKSTVWARSEPECVVIEDKTDQRVMGMPLVGTMHATCWR